MYYRIYQVWEKYGEKFIKYPCIYHPNDKILSYLFQISQSIHLIDIIIYYIYVFNLLEKATAPRSSTLAWKIPWMEEPGRLQSMGSLRVRHDWATSLSLHFHAFEKEMATHSSVLAWRIPGTGEPGGLPSMGSHWVGHDWSDLAAAETSTAH